MIYYVNNLICFSGQLSKADLYNYLSKIIEVRRLVFELNNIFQ